ncbi:MAG: glutathione peroxidase [Saprospiraceae bacterium]|nr:glutathione peroxidase [Saprospiraceae bacterium]
MNINYNTEFYNLSATDIRGKEVSFSEFKDKVVLVVNTASKCGLTPQYEELESLYKKYQDQGLVIIGFPCNQFGNQEPGTETEIQENCLINYGVTFKMFSKVDVNGRNTHPVFSYLKNELGGLLGSRIKWNFTKFLIDRKGYPYKRYAPTTSPAAIEDEISSLINQFQSTEA